MISRIASLVIAIGYLVAALVGGQTSVVFLVAGALLVPLALIWFPEVIGQATGNLGGRSINRETPAVLVSVAGWFLLVGLPVVWYLTSRPGG
jgi:hypothetical protein